MSSCWNSTISGLNKQLGTIRHLEEKYPEQRYFVSLVVFDTEIDTILENEPISKIEDFDGTEFPPRGGTALHDAIGVGISNLKVQLNKKDSDNLSTALVVIMTDGEENSSREHGSDSIKKIISELEKTGAWTFSYMGANQDAVLTASRFGISSGNAINYASTAAGASAAYDTLSRGITSRAKMSNVSYTTSASLGDVSLDAMAMDNTAFFSAVVEGDTIGEDTKNLKEDSSEDKE